MKKILKAGVLSLIVYKIIDFIIHGVIFKNAYLQYADVYRADMNDYMWVFFVGPFIVMMLIAKLYTMVKSESKCTFVMIMPFIIMIPAAFYTWASIDISFTFTLQWFVLGLIQMFVSIKVIAKVLGTCGTKIMRSCVHGYKT